MHNMSIINEMVNMLFNITKVHDSMQGILTKRNLTSVKKAITYENLNKNFQALQLSFSQIERPHIGLRVDLIKLGYDEEAEMAKIRALAERRRSISKRRSTILSNQFMFGSPNSPARRLSILKQPNGEMK